MVARRHPSKVLALPIVLALALAACGGDSDGESSSGDDASNTTVAPDDSTDAPADTTVAPDDSADTTVAPDDSADTTVAPDDSADTTVAPDDAPAAGDVCTADRVGGTLTFAVPSLGGALDPYNQASVGVSGEMVPIYDSLIRYDSETGEFLPQLAESIVANDDASVWTLTLQPGIEFGNGDPMDAAAVKASIDRHLAEGSTSSLFTYSQLIASIDVVDDLTVDFVLTEPWGAFPSSLTSGLGLIVNVARVDEVGADAFAIDPTGGGAGAYEVTKFSPPEVIEFTAKSDWWGGPVCIEKLIYNAIPLAETALDAFVGDEFDAALIDARDPVVSARAVDLGGPTRTLIQNGGGIVVMNNRPDTGPATTDVRVRQAVAAAIDVDLINERAFDGRSYPQAGLISEASETYEATEGPAYDPELAASLVQEVKAEGVWDGTVRFACVGNLSEAAITMAAMLEAVGFTVELQPDLTLSQEIQIVLEGNYELACFGHTPTEASLWEGLRNYDSSNPRNITAFNDPALDAALAVLKTAVSVEEVQSAMQGVQDAWNVSVPAAVYSAFEHVLVWHEDVHGLYFNDTSTVVPYFDQAYIG